MILKCHVVNQIQKNKSNTLIINKLMDFFNDVQLFFIFQCPKMGQIQVFTNKTDLFFTKNCFHMNFCNIVVL